jgi:hypothetical protein
MSAIESGPPETAATTLEPGSIRPRDLEKPLTFSMQLVVERVFEESLTFLARLIVKRALKGGMNELGIISGGGAGT